MSAKSLVLFNFIHLYFLVNEQITENHPLSSYTSRKIDYSAKLNEIIFREELSSQFIVDKDKDFDNETNLLSESLGKNHYIKFITCSI